MQHAAVRQHKPQSHSPLSRLYCWENRPLQTNLQLHHAEPAKTEHKSGPPPNTHTYTMHQSTAWGPVQSHSHTVNHAEKSLCSWESRATGFRMEALWIVAKWDDVQLCLVWPCLALSWLSGASQTKTDWRVGLRTLLWSITILMSAHTAQTGWCTVHIRSGPQKCIGNAIYVYIKHTKPKWHLEFLSHFAFYLFCFK